MKSRIKTRMKSKIKTNSSLEKKLDGTLDGTLDDTLDDTLDNDLKLILNEADKVTMNDLEFDTIFNEQSKILCDIKTLLQNEKTGKTSLSKCNLFEKKGNKNLKQLLYNYRHKYTIKKENVVKENVPKEEGNSQQVSRQHSKITSQSKPRSQSKIRRHSKTRRHSKAKSTKSINRKQLISNDLNLNYPIVFLKNKKPYKNVLMVKNNSKNKA